MAIDPKILEQILQEAKQTAVPSAIPSPVSVPTPSVSSKVKSTLGDILDLPKKAIKTFYTYGVKEPTTRTVSGALKVLEILNRPYSTLMESVRTLAEGTFGDKPPTNPIIDLGTALKKGLTGKVKTGFGDVLTAYGWKPKDYFGKMDLAMTGFPVNLALLKLYQPIDYYGKVDKGVISFIGSLGLDPMMYLGVGEGVGAIKVLNKPLSKFGNAKFLESLGAKIGVKLSKVEDIAKAGEKITIEAWEQTAKLIGQEALKDPNLWFNKTAMYFAGGEIPKTAEMLQGVKKIFSKSFGTIAKIPVAGEFIEISGLRIQKLAGEAFSTGYSIRNAKNLDNVQKANLLTEMEKVRNIKAWEKTLNYYQTQQVFKGMTKAQREQVSFEIEKFLKRETLGSFIDRVQSKSKNLLNKEEIKDFTSFLIKELDKIKKILPETREKIFTRLTQKYSEMIKKDFAKKAANPKLLKQELANLEKITGSKIGVLQRQIDKWLNELTEDLKPKKIISLEETLKKLRKLNSLFKQASPTQKQIKQLTFGIDLPRLKAAWHSAFTARAMNLQEKIFNLIQKLEKQKIYLTGKKWYFRPVKEIVKKGKKIVEISEKRLVDRNIVILENIKDLERTIFDIHNTMVDKNRIISSILDIEKMAIKETAKKPKIIFENKKFQNLYDAFFSDNFVKHYLEGKKFPTLYSLKDITDKSVRKVVSVFQEKMKEIGLTEIKLDIRDMKQLLDDPRGYIKRMAKGYISPQDVEISAYEARKAGVPTIEEAQKQRKWSFEADAAKAYLARLNQFTTSRVNKMFTDWLVAEKYLFKELPEQIATQVGKIPSKMKEVELWGKKLYGTPELIDELTKIAPEMTDKGIRSMWSLYDKLLNVWKTSKTAMWLSFHSRNAMSNVYLGWLGGNKDLETYKIASELQLLGNNMLRGKKVVGDKMIDLGIRGKMKIKDFYNIMGEKGILGTGFMGKEFWEGHIPVTNQDMLERLYTLPRRFGTAVENNARIALFIDQIKKGADFDSAALTVKKFLFDYGDLTIFEKSVMKRIVPFYTWLRKNIPLMLEQVVKQPGKFVAPLHLKESIETISPAQEELFLPDWLKTGELNIRLPFNYYYFPDMPFQDLATLGFNQYSFKTLASSISPLIKFGFEVIANYDIYRDKPLADQSLPKEIRLRKAFVQELVNEFGRFNIWKQASIADKNIYLALLYYITGIRLIKYDEMRSIQNYFNRQRQEQGALRRLERE